MTKSIVFLDEIRDFAINGKIQEIADNEIQGDREPTKSDILSNIAWDNYPDRSFEILIEEINEFHEELAELIGEVGIDFSVIAKGDCFSLSGYQLKDDDFAIDTEQWYMSDRTLYDAIYKIEQDESGDYYAEIEQAIENFAFNLCEEIQEYLDSENISFDDLNRYLLPENFLNKSVTIENITNDPLYIETDCGCLDYPENCDDWDFIDRYRGSLIFPTEITNLQLLPKDIRDRNIFAIA